MLGAILQPYIPILKNAVDDITGFFPNGLILSVAAGCVEHRKHWEAYYKEFIGTLLMVVFTFSAGKWIGGGDMMIAWSAHSVGVILADYLGTCDTTEFMDSAWKCRCQQKENQPESIP